MSEPVHTGGCHCGRIRFRARGEPVMTGWCHCSVCRRTTGAPALSWVTWETAAVEIAGEPAVYRSSDIGVRLFCPTCGAQISYRSDAGTTLDLNVGVFDEPERFPPRAHGFAADRLAWFDAGRGLPEIPDGDA